MTHGTRRFRGHTGDRADGDVPTEADGLGLGQALVEFALILPLLLLLTVGIVDFSRIFVSYIALTNAVREGTLYAAEGDRTLASEYIAHITSRMQPEADAGGITLSGITIECSLSPTAAAAAWAPCTDGVKPTFVRVGASYNMSLITPFFAPIPMSVRTITASIGPAPTPAPSASPSAAPSASASVGPSASP